MSYRLALDGPTNDPGHTCELEDCTLRRFRLDGVIYEHVPVLRCKKGCGYVALTRRTLERMDEARKSLEETA